MKAFVGFRSTQFKLRRFFRRRAHLLVFFGALVVFITFLLNEGARDSWKEEAGALETARYIYGIRAQSHIQQDTKDLESVENKILELRADKSMSDIDKYLAATSLEGKILQATDEAERKVNALNIIATKLPEKNAARVNFEAQSVRLSAISVEETSMRFSDSDSITVAALEVAEIDKDENSSKEIVDSELDSDTGTVGSLLTLNLDLEDERLELEKATNEQLTHYEMLSSFAWWGTATFFSLGWGLGLVGKLYGVPEAAGGE